MDEKDVILIKAAVAGVYGRETTEMAKNWAICSLLQGKKIPLSLSELYEAYHDFDTAFVSEFVKHQDWGVIWKMSEAYCEYKDVHLVWSRILLELLASPIEQIVKEHIQTWLLLHTENPKVAFILLKKAQKYPQLMDWGLCYLAKYKEFSDANELMSLIKCAAHSYPNHILSAVRLLSCVARSGCHVQAVKILAELLLMKELDDIQKCVLNEEISHQLDLMNVRDLRRCLRESILSAEYRVSVGTRIVRRGYWDDSIIDNIFTIYQRALFEKRDNAKLIESWNLFVDAVLEYRQCAMTEVFMAVNEMISSYVKTEEWDISHMEWNPGVNFQNYAPDFMFMAIKSLDYAMKCKQFHPCAFLTALNIWLFSECNSYDDKWFENVFSLLPQNDDKSIACDDNLQVLFNHLARVYRYCTEIQEKDGSFVIKQAKLFVQLLVANYALNPTQISLMRHLCERLKLDVLVDFEIQEMEKRVEQLRHQKEMEQHYLLELFTV